MHSICYFTLLLQAICSPRLQSGKSNTSVTEYLTSCSRVWTRLQTTINRLAVEATSVRTCANVFTLMGKFGSDPSTYKREATYYSWNTATSYQNSIKTQITTRTPLPTLVNTCKLAWMLIWLRGYDYEFYENKDTAISTYYQNVIPSLYEISVSIAEVLESLTPLQLLHE